MTDSENGRMGTTHFPRHAGLEFSYTRGIKLLSTLIMLLKFDDLGKFVRSNEQKMLDECYV